VLLPWTLSGDYSFRAEPVPARPVFFGSVAGALLAVVPLVAGVFVLLRNLLASFRMRSAEPIVRQHRLAPGALLATGLLWFPLAYFPHSNIPVLLPTVRAERFWYLPVVGTSIVLALVAAKLLSNRRQRLGAECRDRRGRTAAGEPDGLGQCALLSTVLRGDLSRCSPRSTDGVIPAHAFCGVVRW